jgi:hypothetical protein
VRLLVETLKQRGRSKQAASKQLSFLKDERREFCSEKAEKKQKRSRKSVRRVEEGLGGSVEGHKSVLLAPDSVKERHFEANDRFSPVFCSRGRIRDEKGKTKAQQASPA